MADQIAKVHLKNGKEQWVLVHTEVQSEDQDDFPLRMFQYYYRIFDRYGKKIVAIAVFSNKSNKSSNQYKDVYFGTELSYTFNKYVVDNFDVEELKNSPKLFSKALLASIYMNRTKSNNEMEMRSIYKRALLRDVWSLQNATRTEISALLYFVDYLLKLSEEMSEQLKQELRTEIRKEDEQMLQLHKDELPPTLAGILEMERQEGLELGIERGIEQGIEQGIRQMILNLIEKGFTEEVIADVAKITVEQVQEFRKEMS